MDETKFKELRHADVYCVDVAFVSSSSSSTSALFGQQSTENQNYSINFELPVAFDDEKAVEKGNVSSLIEELPELSELPEQESTGKLGKYNLRKSLDWDTAFFTNAGLLEPGELSCMIKGVNNGGKHFSPGIAEDIHRSNDSISTLESESLTMGSLEADLFENIRASIQKSSKAYHMAISEMPPSKLTRPSCSIAPHVPSAVCDVPLCHLYVNYPSTSKKTVMVKSEPAAKNQGAGMQGPEKLIKQRVGYSLGIQPVQRNGGLNSFLRNRKASKEISKSSPISSAPLERPSLGNDKARSASVYGRVHLASDSCPSRAATKPAVSSKSPSPSSSTTKKEPLKSSSSSARSGSRSPANICASSVKSTRRKFGTAKIANLTSDGLILKTRGSSTISSNVSPVSSISEWSSESSSSASRNSFDTGSPCRSQDNDIPPPDCCNQSNGHVSDEHNKATLPHGETIKAVSGQLGGHSQPAMAKPSGLRKPSARIGFFDWDSPTLVC
ncbi:uncharacterized protein LOC127810203 isoform X2 [Diospyros lotus]|uniref:uncharacterized protein LOC127810203 isoform X2 n=1 Tax=Diospyros lotus TaxID=55363 RepID=UPI00225B703B|nr:uncharacterized protein LOC127810203 isoform X2 [Diospyros lotus]